MRTTTNRQLDLRRPRAGLVGRRGEVRGMLAYSLDLLAGLGTLSREQDVQILLSTKNALVGHRERKVDLLRSGLLHR